MAHNLTFIGGKHSFASADRLPWHGLGQIVKGAMTSEECIVAAGLDFEVDKLPTFISIPESESRGAATKEVPNSFATYRTDTRQVFGAVGSRYHIVQNLRAFDFFDSIVGKGEAVFETAGALGNGETVFITAKLPAYINVRQEDLIDQYLVLVMTHDGTGSIRVMFTPVRVVCANTLRAALNRNSNAISIRHTASADSRLKDAARVMGITNQLSRELEEVLNHMTTIKITDTQLRDYIDTLVLGKSRTEILGENEDAEVSTRSANIITRMEDYYFTGYGQQMDICQGTAYGAYNAVTGYFANIKNFKSKEDKMASNLLGANANTMQKALVLANKMFV